MFELNSRTFAEKNSAYFMCFFAAVLILLGFYDLPISHYLIKLSNSSFVNFQSQSLFSDGNFGGSDFGTFFQIFCFFYVIFFVLKKNLRSPFQVYLARYCTYVVLASVYYALVLVQGMKFAAGRTRPYIVMNEVGISNLYSEWYELGLHSISSGKYAGSFPSGHTASASAFFALLFFSWFKGWTPLKRRFFTLTIIAFSFSQWLFMGVARVMGKDHWPTDCAAAGLFAFGSFAFFARKIQLNSLSPASLHSSSSQNSQVLPAGFIASYCRTLGVSLLLILLLWSTRETILP